MLHLDPFSQRSISVGSHRIPRYILRYLDLDDIPSCPTGGRHTSTVYRALGANSVSLNETAPCSVPLAARHVLLQRLIDVTLRQFFEQNPYGTLPETPHITHISAPLLVVVIDACCGLVVMMTVMQRPFTLLQVPEQQQSSSCSC